ncbi:hypothetical protein [Paenibacillus mucilaginosus]|nr:hypothetical protein [Paenibacillus mucilaginosus]
MPRQSVTHPELLERQGYSEELYRHSLGAAQEREAKGSPKHGMV